MQISKPTLFNEIKNLKFNFFVSSYDENENLKITHKSHIFSMDPNSNKILNLRKLIVQLKKIFYL